MTTLRRLTTGLIIWILLRPLSSDAQPVERLANGRPVNAEFSDLSFALLLNRRSALVVDRREQVVSMLDLSTGESTPLGRRGDGPGEFRFPWSVFRIGGAPLPRLWTAWRGCGGRDVPHGAPAEKLRRPRSARTSTRTTGW